MLTATSAPSCNHNDSCHPAVMTAARVSIDVGSGLTYAKAGAGNAAAATEARQAAELARMAAWAVSTGKKYVQLAALSLTCNISDSNPWYSGSSLKHKQNAAWQSPTANNNDS
jgi:hypothetical protein